MDSGRWQMTATGNVGDQDAIISDSPSKDEERDDVGRYFDDSAEEVVDVSVTGELTSAK